MNHHDELLLLIILVEDLDNNKIFLHKGIFMVVFSYSNLRWSVLCRR